MGRYVSSGPCLSVMLGPDSLRLMCASHRSNTRPTGSAEGLGDISIDNNENNANNGCDDDENAEGDEKDKVKVR